MYRVALHVLRAPDRAEDAAQDALLRAYQARHTFEGRSQPDAWLYRIAYRTALSHLRQPFVRRFVAADVYAMIDETSLQESSAEGDIAANRLAAALDECLQSMRRADRVAFVERFVLGTSERDLGSILGVTANAAKQRAFRARRHVRTRIAESGLVA